MVSSLHWETKTSQKIEKTRQNLKLQGSVEMFASFNHHGHVCIVFEVLGKSVFDFLKDNGFTPFPLVHIQRMADDVLAALSFLHGNFTVRARNNHVLLVQIVLVARASHVQLSNGNGGLHVQILHTWYCELHNLGIS